MGQQKPSLLRALIALTEAQVSFPSTLIRWLTSNSIFRRADALYWSLWVLHSFSAYILRKDCRPSHP